MWGIHFSCHFLGSGPRPGSHDSGSLEITPSNSDGGERLCFEKHHLSTYRFISCAQNMFGDYIIYVFFTAGVSHILCNYSIMSTMISTLSLFHVPCHTMLNSVTYVSSNFILLKITETPKDLLFMWVILMIFRNSKWEIFKIFILSC